MLRCEFAEAGFVGERLPRSSDRTMMNTPASVEQHLSAFVDAFVVPTRRERWKYLLAHRSKGAYRDSSQLMTHLDAQYCKQVDGDFKVNLKAQGISTTARR